MNGRASVDTHGVDALDEYWVGHPNPSDEEILDVCRAWVTYQRETADDVGTHDEHRCWWAVEAVTEADNDPMLLWRVIQGLCSLVAANDEPVVAMIAADPLWTLIAKQGDRAMDLIEPAADLDPVLLVALQGVWAWDWPVEPRIERYLAARG